MNKFFKFLSMILIFNILHTNLHAANPFTKAYYDQRKMTRDKDDRDRFEQAAEAHKATRFNLQKADLDELAKRFELEKTELQELHELQELEKAEAAELKKPKKDSSLRSNDPGNKGWKTTYTSTNSNKNKRVLTEEEADATKNASQNAFLEKKEKNKQEEANALAVLKKEEEALKVKLVQKQKKFDKLKNEKLDEVQSTTLGKLQEEQRSELQKLEAAELQKAKAAELQEFRNIKLDELERFRVTAELPKATELQKLEAAELKKAELQKLQELQAKRMLDPNRMLTDDELRFFTPEAIIFQANTRWQMQETIRKQIEQIVMSSPKTLEAFRDYNKSTDPSIPIDPSYKIFPNIWKQVQIPFRDERISIEELQKRFPSINKNEQLFYNGILDNSLLATITHIQLLNPEQFTSAMKQAVDKNEEAIAKKAKDEEKNRNTIAQIQRQDDSFLYQAKLQDEYDILKREYDKNPYYVPTDSSQAIRFNQRMHYLKLRLNEIVKLLSK